MDTEETRWIDIRYFYLYDTNGKIEITKDLPHYDNKNILDYEDFHKRFSNNTLDNNYCRITLPNISDSELHLFVSTDFELTMKQIEDVAYEN